MSNFLEQVGNNINDGGLIDNSFQACKEGPMVRSKVLEGCDCYAVQSIRLALHGLTNDKPRRINRKICNELLAKATYGKLSGKSVREKYVKWIKRGYWVLSPQCVVIMTYLLDVGAATRSCIDTHLRMVGYAGFEYQAEALQRLLLFGAIRRDRLGRFTLYRLTSLGRKIIREAINGQRSRYIPITKSSESDLILVSW